MKYLLDTDTTSQPSKPGPNAAYLQWLSLQAPATLAISVMSVLEINFGVTLLPAGKRRTALHTWVDESLPTMFDGRILPVTVEIAADAGKLLARKKLEGYTIEMADALIASTARVHGLAIVTLNRKHFQKLEVPLVSF